MPRRFQRRSRSPDGPHVEEATVPAGAVLVGRRMAAEGYSREDIDAFLSANFRRFDLSATLDRVFEASTVES